MTFAFLDGKIDGEATRVPLDDGATERLHIDKTALASDACADMIANWIVAPRAGPKAREPPVRFTRGCGPQRIPPLGGKPKRP